MIFAFREGNITYQNLQNINRVTNHHLYPESSVTADDNYEQPPFHEDSESKVEEEHHPLAILDPLAICLTTPRIRAVLRRAITNYKLERHLGTIIEEIFRERMTLESE